MVSIEEVAQIAMELPEVTEGARHGHRTWFVGGKAFAWDRPFSKADIKRFGDETPPDGPILAVSVADLHEKEAVLAAQPKGFFTISHFDGYAAVLIQLKKVTKKALREAIVDGWLAVAPTKLADEYVATERALVADDLAPPVSATFDAVDIDRLRRRRTVKWTLYGPDVLAAWVAEMDFDVAPVVRDAIVEAVEREDFGYLEPDLSELTQACADFFATRYAWTVPPARIFPVADVLIGIQAAFDVFSPPGTGVVVPTPAYPPFFEVVELAGRELVTVPMVQDAGRDGLDIDRIAAALAAGARTVLLCNPHNPTGRVFTIDELGALAAVVDLHGARVVADEVHAPLVYGSARHIPYATVSDAAAEHSVTVTSASKAFNLAGLKCAQVVATNHADAARWRALRVFEVAGPTPIGIAATTAAYRDGGDWLADLVAYLDRNRRRLLELLAAELPDVSCNPPEATFLSWLDCAALDLGDPARFFLDQAHVAVSDGPPFGPGSEGNVRLNFATSRAILEGILGAMGDAVRTRRSR